jgi:hypothetical protein
MIVTRAYILGLLLELVQQFSYDNDNRYLVSTVTRICPQLSYRDYNRYVVSNGHHIISNRFPGGKSRGLSICLEEFLGSQVV